MRTMLKQVITLVASLEGLGLLASLAVGIGSLVYLSAAWVTYFAMSGESWTAVCVASATLLVGGAALFRVPAALLLIFVSAMVLGTAFFAGAIGVFFP